MGWQAAASPLLKSCSDQPAIMQCKPERVRRVGMSKAQRRADGATDLKPALFHDAARKDPTREVGLQSVTMPPGGGNKFHRHPGDQWTAIQEGEITFTVKGKPPQVLKAGDYNYVPRGTVHRQQNLSGRPAHYIEMRIFDKGKPASEPVPI
jgi:quercetin dioxygenase-like cupin family protein